MFASIFQGAQGLFVWTLDWLNFGARDHSGQDLLNTAEASQLHLSSENRVQPSPKGSFEQVDRAIVLDQISNWSEDAPALQVSPEETELLVAAAWIETASGSDADLILQFVLSDANGLEQTSLEQLADGVGQYMTNLTFFSPLIQPSVDVELDALETAGLITLSGTANAALDQVYLPLSFSIDDAHDIDTAFNTLVDIWDTDLI